jgi:hypothetical protein
MPLVLLGAVLLVRTEKLAPSPQSYAIYFAILAALLIVAIIFYLAFERHTHAVRSFVSSRLSKVLPAR